MKGKDYINNYDITNTIINTKSNKTTPKTNNRTDKSYTNIWKIMVFISFIVLVSIVNYYHEAWYDEAQAWMIAKE